mmetsp:Transcript_28114/g.64685  ORF Transcript_28114/g.64685 Transcript_28114/m.64685 type:complete len:234 (+) Transcript_28114:839-1540(+)
MSSSSASSAILADAHNPRTPSTMSARRARRYFPSKSWIRLRRSSTHTACNASTESISASSARERRSAQCGERSTRSSCVESSPRAAIETKSAAVGGGTREQRGVHSAPLSSPTRRFRTVSFEACSALALFAREGSARSGRLTCAKRGGALRARGASSRGRDKGCAPGRMERTHSASAVGRDSPATSGESAIVLRLGAHASPAAVSQHPVQAAVGRSAAASAASRAANPTVPKA